MKKASTILLCCMAFSLPAKAELLTYNFTATIERLTDSWNITPSTTFAGYSFALGDQVKGSLTYNTATPRSWFQPVPDGWSKEVAYGGPNLGNAMTLTYVKNNLTFTFDVPRIEIRSGLPDWIRFQGNGDATDAKMTLASYYKDLPPTNLPARLPAYFPNSPTAFRIFDVNQYLGSGNTAVTIVNRIDSFNLMPTTPVPEPTTYAMLLAGLAGVGIAVRRRQARG